MIRTLYLAVVVFAGTFSSACGGQGPAPAEPGPSVRADSISLRADDRIRLAEAFRLAEQLRDHIWQNWSQAPLALLLVTPEHEFLVRHPCPTEEFRLLGYDSLLQSEVHVRPRQYPPNLLASFPAVAGVPTVVMGQPENTDRTSTPWVLSLLHEHFHQLQYSRPDYYAGVEALDLSGGDQTGMWMLNYPFPYDSALLQQRFASMALALREALETAGTERFPARIASLQEARAVFGSALSGADYRYFAFQEWQEGVARYTEYRIAQLAASQFTPAPAFRALPDYTPFTEAAGALERSIMEGIRTADLGRQQRVAFYPLGAAMALLLDRAVPDWKQQYFSEAFALDRYFNMQREERGIGVLAFAEPPGTGRVRTDMLRIRAEPSSSASERARFYLHNHSGSRWSYELRADPPARSNAVEFAYEEKGLPFDSLAGAWARVIYGWPADGPPLRGWVSLAESQARALFWADLLRQRTLFWEDSAGARFYDAPGGSAVDIRLTPPTGAWANYDLAPVRTEGPWMLVRVVVPSICSGERDSMERLAWIRYLDPAGRPLVRARTRGC